MNELNELIGLLEDALARHDRAKATGKAAPDLTSILAALAGLLGGNNPPALLQTILEVVLKHPDILALLVALFKRVAGAGSASVPSGSGDGGGSTGDPVRVARIEARVKLFGPKRTGRDPLAFKLEGEQIVLDMPPDPDTGDKQTDLDDGSVIAVEADYYDQFGHPLRIDLDPTKTPPGGINHPEFLGRFRFEAWSLDDKLLLGAIGPGDFTADPATIDHQDGTVHWLDPKSQKGPGAYRRSGGVWAECAVRTQCRISVVYVDDDAVRSNGFVTPGVN